MSNKLPRYIPTQLVSYLVLGWLLKFSLTESFLSTEDGFHQMSHVSHKTEQITARLCWGIVDNHGTWTVTLHTMSNITKHSAEVYRGYVKLMLTMKKKKENNTLWMGNHKSTCPCFININSNNITFVCCISCLYYYKWPHCIDQPVQPIQRYVCVRDYLFIIVKGTHSVFITWLFCWSCLSCEGSFFYLNW